MDWNLLLTFLQTIGFPICMCLAMGWFVYYMYNQNMEQIKTLTKEHQEETKELKGAIENNTIAITQMIEVIKGLKEHS